MKTNEELKKQIEELKEKSEAEAETKRLKQELFTLKNRKLVGFANKFNKTFDKVARKLTGDLVKGAKWLATKPEEKKKKGENTNEKEKIH